MTKIVIDMTMSLDGYVAGPGDDQQNPLGLHDGMRIFDWYGSGTEEIGSPLFKPAPGVNRDEVERMFEELGAYVFGRRTYDIVDGWGGRHPVNGAPVFVLTPQSARRLAARAIPSELRHRRYRKRHKAGAGSGRGQGCQAGRGLAGQAGAGRRAGG